MITFPKAKINFGLRITGKRPDGFHDIETIFYPVPFCDALEFVVPSGNVTGDELVATGINISTRPKDNLVIRAVTRIRQDHKFPFLKIHLHKAIPAGAGLGGGSSDAGHLLKSVDRYFNLGIEEDDLKQYALEIGSDCPFFLDPVPSLATGRGEMLKHVDPFLEGLWLVLVNPGIHISTRDAYLNTGISHSRTGLEKIVSGNPGKWKKLAINDFEDYVFKLYPAVAGMKKSLYKAGAIFSSMSGSGSTVYGIFRDKPELPEDLMSYVIYAGVI